MLDPVEALMAVTGVGFATGERMAKIDVTEIERARKLPEKVETMIRSALNGSLDHRSPAPVNFRRSLTKLSRLDRHEDHVEIIEKFPRGYRKLATAYTIHLAQLRREIRKMIPASVYQTVTGPVVSPPTDLKFWSFLSVLQAIDEPLTVIRGIGTGTLTKKQSLAIKTVYPSLADLITTTLVEEIVSKEATSRDGWRPNWIVNKGLAAWFETSPIPPDMLRRLQASHVALQNQAPPPPTSPPNEQHQSPSQRAQFGAVG